MKVVTKSKLFGELKKFCKPDFGLIPKSCVAKAFDNAQFDVPTDIKVVLKVDSENGWEHVVVYKNRQSIDDGLENHSLDAIDLLKYLSELGLFELEIEEIDISL